MTRRPASAHGARGLARRVARMSNRAAREGRKRFRKVGLVAVTVMTVAGLVLAANGLASGASSNKFQGTLSAELSGSIRFMPGLLLTTGSTGTVKVTITGTLSNVSGTTSYDGTTITGGSYRSVVTLPAASSCLSLETNGLPPGIGRVTFTSTGTLPAAASKVTWGSETTSGPPVVVGLGGPGTSVAGSFAKPSGPQSAASLVIDQSQTALLDACESTNRLTKMTFTGKGGASTLELG